MSIWVGKDSSIKTIADLKGKTLEVTRAGSESHTIARLTLRSAGIADNEVKYLHDPGLPEAFISLDLGLVDASFGSPPRPGFRELVDLSSLKIPFLQGAIEVRRSFLQNRRHRAQSSTGVRREHQACERKTRAHHRLDRKTHESLADIVRSAYQPHANVFEEIPFVRKDSVQAILDLYPKDQLRNVQFEKLVDNSLLQQLEDSGFIKALYRKD